MIRDIIIYSLLVIALVVFTLITGGCAVHSIEKVEFKDNQQISRVSYWSGMFLADLDKQQAYGKTDELEISFGKSEASVDPNVVEGLTKGIVEGIKGIK